MIKKNIIRFFPNLYFSSFLRIINFIYILRRCKGLEIRVPPRNTEF